MAQWPTILLSSDWPFLHPIKASDWLAVTQIMVTCLNWVSGGISPLLSRDSLSPLAKYHPHYTISSLNICWVLFVLSEDYGTRIKTPRQWRAWPRTEKQEAPLSAEDQGQGMQSAGNILHFCPFVSKHGLGMGIYRYPPVTTIQGGQPRKLRSEAEECIRHWHSGEFYSQDMDWGWLEDGMQLSQFIILNQNKSN